MTNRVLPERFVESIQRLALGLEPVDALGLGSVGHRLHVTLDGPPLPVPRFRRTTANPFLPEDSLRRFQRHNSCRFVLVWDEPLDPKIQFRIVDPSRRYVPRRLQITVPTLKQLDAADTTAPFTAIPAMPRVRRPFLFPGASYDPVGGATGVRGQVTRGGVPMRWARVEAKAKGGAKVIGRAHGDDRGEFLLVLGRNDGAITALPKTLELEITMTVTGPRTPPPALPPGSPPDPLRDLPLEIVTDTTVLDDDVSTGKTNPYDPNPASATVDLLLPYGTVRSLVPPIAL